MRCGLLPTVRVTGGSRASLRPGANVRKLSFLDLLIDPARGPVEHQSCFAHVEESKAVAGRGGVQCLFEERDAGAVEAGSSLAGFVGDGASQLGGDAQTE